MTFARAVYRMVQRIPKGSVVTYGQVAALLGAPRRARAVGHAMSRCPDTLPWHRVVNARGGISVRPRMEGMITQRMRLLQEGVRFRRGLVDLRQHRWEPRGARRQRGEACVSR